MIYAWTKQKLHGRAEDKHTCWWSVIWSQILLSLDGVLCTFNGQACLETTLWSFPLAFYSYIAVQEISCYRISRLISVTRACCRILPSSYLCSFFFHICFYLCYGWAGIFQSVQWLAVGWQTKVLFWVGLRNFLSLYSDQIWGTPSFLSSGYWVLFSEGLSNINVKLTTNPILWWS
jgi:hypothetical protein